MTVTIHEILENLERARVYASSYNFSKSEFYLSLAINSFSEALNSVSRWWRFRNVYGGFMWIYSIGILGRCLLCFLLSC